MGISVETIITTKTVEAILTLRKTPFGRADKPKGRRWPSASQHKRQRWHWTHFRRYQILYKNYSSTPCECFDCCRLSVLIAKHVHYKLFGSSIGQAVSVGGLLASGRLLFLLFGCDKDAVALYLDVAIVQSRL
jgi:hypothetical protein